MLPPLKKELRGTPSLVLLTHTRTAHLREVLESLALNTEFNRHRLIVVNDGGHRDVLDIVQSSRIPDLLISVNLEPDTPPAERINRAAFFGLDSAFSQLGSNYAVVIEDDIVVSPDFLSFVHSMHALYGRNPWFRGINGFSNYKLPGQTGHILLNYGVGWGWSISAKQFHKVREHWRDNGNLHWDSLIEPYIRSGFVVNPVYSKIINLGFDSTATHSVGEATAQLDRDLRSSFSLGSGQGEGSDYLQETVVEMNWRSDCIPIGKLGTIRTILLYQSHRIRFCLEKIRRKNSGRISSYAYLLLSRTNRVVARLQNLDNTV